MEVKDPQLDMKRVHLQRFRLALLVDLNRVYPETLDVPSLAALHESRGQRTILREKFYLTEIGFLHASQDERWRITALGRDFLLGIVDAKGILSPVLLGDIGED